MRDGAPDGAGNAGAVERGRQLPDERLGAVPDEMPGLHLLLSAAGHGLGVGGMRQRPARLPRQIGGVAGRIDKEVAARLPDRGQGMGNRVGEEQAAAAHGFEDAEVEIVRGGLVDDHPGPGIDRGVLSPDGVDGEPELRQAVQQGDARRVQRGVQGADEGHVVDAAGPGQEGGLAGEAGRQPGHRALPGPEALHLVRLGAEDPVEQCGVMGMPGVQVGVHGVPGLPDREALQAEVDEGGGIVHLQDAVWTGGLHGAGEQGAGRFGVAECAPVRDAEGMDLVAGPPQGLVEQPAADAEEAHGGGEASPCPWIS